MKIKLELTPCSNQEDSEKAYKRCAKIFPASEIELTQGTDSFKTGTVQNITCILEEKMTDEEKEKVLRKLKLFYSDTMPSICNGEAGVIYNTEEILHGDKISLKPTRNNPNGINRNPDTNNQENQNLSDFLSYFTQNTHWKNEGKIEIVIEQLNNKSIGSLVEYLLDREKYGKILCIYGIGSSFINQLIHYLICYIQTNRIRVQNTYNFEEYPMLETKNPFYQKYIETIQLRNELHYSINCIVFPDTYSAQ